MSTIWSLLLIFAASSASTAADDNEIEVDLNSAQWVVSDQFLSVTIDAGIIRYGDWTKYPFTSPKMLNLARALSPAMLRVGGTSQDYLIFQKNKTQFTDDFSMTTEDWDVMNEFTRLAKWDFIFGLNALLRNVDGSWNSSNARDLFEYTRSKNYLVNWELGNEPDHYNVNDSVAPEQMAADFSSLQKVLSGYDLKPEYIAGPDVASQGKFLDEFVVFIDTNVVNAITWHHYYLNGAKATLPDMFSIEVLDNFILAALGAEVFIHLLHSGTELWLGETSSCYGGGSPKLSSSFVAGFMWLDKLGIAALTNHTRVFRQDYIGGFYSLLDSSFNPLPDYWLSVLHKRLVGTVVLDVKGALEPGRHVRVYAHCAKQPLYSAGDVTLLVLNVHTYDTTATLLSPSLAAAPRDIYLLFPPGNTTNVLSTEVALNGVVLSLVNNTVLPDLPPLTQSATPTLHLPALTFGFYVFKGVQAKACL